MQLQRTIVFVHFGAEEQGVKSSEFCVAYAFVPNARTKACLNLESVGRGERISAGSGRNDPQLRDVVDRNNTKYVHRRVSAVFTANLARPQRSRHPHRTCP